MTCDGCSAEFDKKPHSRPNTRFCSTDCRVLWHERTNPEYAEMKRRMRLENWHKPGGGYVRRRRRTLAQQRVEVQRQLAEVMKRVDQP